MCITVYFKIVVATSPHLCLSKHLDYQHPLWILSSTLGPIQVTKHMLGLQAQTEHITPLVAILTFGLVARALISTLFQVLQGDLQSCLEQDISRPTCWNEPLVHGQHCSTQRGFKHKEQDSLILFYCSYTHTHNYWTQSWFISRKGTIKGGVPCQVSPYIWRIHHMSQMDILIHGVPVHFSLKQTQCSHLNINNI